MALSDDLRAILGREGLEALSAEFGGEEKYIPRGPVADSHWLVEAVGRDRAKALQWHFGGGNIRVPSGPGRRLRRDDKIRFDARGGRSLAALAREHRLSVRQVRRIVSSPPPRKSNLSAG